MESAAGSSSGDRSSSLRTLMFNDKIDTPNLGDFLRVKENNNNNNISSGLTLGAALSNKRGEDDGSSSSSSSPVHSSSRTLLDIISEDSSSSRKSRKTWKHFRNKLRLKHTARTWTSSSNPIMSRRLSPPPSSQNENLGQLEVSASGSRNVDDENGVEEESEGENAIGVGEEDQPVRMSLMALLEENDGDGSAYIMGDEDEDEEEEDGDAGVVSGAGAGTGGEYNNCCVCMVRHKGAAFIPCGHTFCRLCSRELWAQRGNCPLCNNFILEILDIF